MTEIAYSIDPTDSETYQGLVIRFLTTEKEKLAPILSPLSPSILRQMSKPIDREAVDFLIKQEWEFQRQQIGRSASAESCSFHCIHIENNQVMAALKLMAATQKLYFKAKQLVVDFFGKVEFYYQAEVLSSTTMQVTGRLKWRDQDISVRDCDFLGAGKPNWFIKGIALKMITTGISWKRIKQSVETSPWILEGAQRLAFLDQIDPEDLDGPQLVFIGGSPSDFPPTLEPTPVLLLKDRMGAFADLWMDYEGHQIAAHDPRKEWKILPENILLKRQWESEKGWEKDLLETDFIKKDVGTSHYYCPVNKVAKSLAFLLDIGWPIQDWKGNRVIRQGASQLTIDPSEQALVIKGKIQYDQYEANLTDVLGAFNRRERFIQLGEGLVGFIPDQWEQKELQELTDEAEIIGQEVRVKSSRLASLSSLLTHSQLPPSLVDLQQKLKDFTKIEQASVGEEFKGQLRPYQQQGLNWMTFLARYGFHGILADDMGLGKTIQVLALLSRFPRHPPHLIVVPTSLLFNWKNEIERFLPHWTPYVHQGPERAQTSEKLSQHSIILTSYTLLRLDLPLFQQLSYHTVILDEAQVIKNAHTQTAQAVCSLTAQFRLSMTGTPVENHLGELWSHFHFLMPDLFGDEEAFTADLQAASVDSRHLQRIKKKIAPFILRRKKEEVAQDLPERIDQIIWVEMSPEQRRLYDQFLAGIRGNLLKKVEIEGAQRHRMEILEAILRLRQICCHPLLVSSLYEEGESLTSAKLDALERDVETAIEEGHKVLIYSQFTSMLKIMTQMAHQKKWTYTYLDGSTIHREKVVAQFQNDPTLSLFFISLKAGGVGLNLTAADYVFLYDPWWNEAVEEQAISRAHRIGRQQTVIAKRFATVESIEEKMMKLKANKRILVEEIVENETDCVNLTLDDLRYLLS